MKNIKTSNIRTALGVLLVAAAMVAQNVYQTTNESTTQTETQESTFWNNAFGEEEATHRTERVATVAIVYPRVSGDIDPCNNDTTAEGKTITHIFVAEDSKPFCSMNSAQIKDFASTTEYEKNLFCQCATNFCDDTPEAAANFKECLNKAERI